jgi:hypothetical protein
MLYPFELRARDPRSESILARMAGNGAECAAAVFRLIAFQPDQAAHPDSRVCNLCATCMARSILEVGSDPARE